jgi:hypothetical protein
MKTSGGKKNQNTSNLDLQLHVPLTMARPRIMSFPITGVVGLSFLPVHPNGLKHGALEAPFLL